MPSYARRHFARGPCRAASAARSGGGALRSSPARSALSAFAVQLRPRFPDAPASGICSLRLIQAACDTQRFVRRLAIGSAVMHSVCGVFTAFRLLLVCASPTTANLGLRAAATRERSDSCRVESKPTFGQRGISWLWRKRIHCWSASAARTSKAPAMKAQPELWGVTSAPPSTGAMIPVAPTMVSFPAR